MRTVPIAPTTIPAFLKATGMANTPDPSEALSRFAKAPKLLKSLHYIAIPLNVREIFHTRAT